jgi:hypothetical protein
LGGSINNIRQHHKTVTTIRTGTRAIAAIQSSSRFLKKVIQTTAFADCANNAINLGSTSLNSTIHGIPASKDLGIKSNRLFSFNFLDTAINRLKHNIRAVGCFDNLTRLNFVALVNLPHLTFGIGGGDFPFDIGCFHFGHDRLLIGLIYNLKNISDLGGMIAVLTK